MVDAEHNTHLQYLNSSQALADLDAFRTHAIRSLGISPKAPWVGIGGSYPGMLAAFLRATYPDSFVASVASSAPVHGVLDMSSFQDIKAGAYAIQGGAAGFVTEVAGCRENVVGLSIPAVLAALKSLGAQSAG